MRMYVFFAISPTCECFFLLMIEADFQPFDGFRSLFEFCLLSYCMTFFNYPLICRDLMAEIASAGKVAGSKIGT